MLLYDIDRVFVINKTREAQLYEQIQSLFLGDDRLIFLIRHTWIVRLTTESNLILAIRVIAQNTEDELLVHAQVNTTNIQIVTKKICRIH